MRNDTISAREAWLQGSLGAGVLAAEAELLSSTLDDVFGLELLQLGCWGSTRALLAGSRTRRQTLIAEQPGVVGVDLQARPNAARVIRLGMTTFYERARRKLRLTDSAELDPSALARSLADRPLLDRPGPAC